MAEIGSDLDLEGLVLSKVLYRLVLRWWVGHADSIIFGNTIVSFLFLAFIFIYL